MNRFVNLTGVVIFCLMFAANAHAFGGGKWDMSAADKVGHMQGSAATGVIMLYACDVTESCTWSPEAVAALNIGLWWLKGPTYDTWKANPTGTSVPDGAADVIGGVAAYGLYKLYRHFYPKKPFVAVPVIRPDEIKLTLTGEF